jgi:ATP-dependent Lhr-like helicase
MVDAASSAPSSAFFLLDERIQKWIWQSGWTELRDAQERAIAPILAGNKDVVIAAATAAGKTEAAFLPILTSLLRADEPSCAIYVSPLKALINDQWGRLEGLCESLEVP